MVNKCKFDSSKWCYHLSCGIFDSVSSNVSVCPLFRGGDMLASRKVVFVRNSFFAKHRLRHEGGH